MTPKFKKVCFYIYESQSEKLKSMALQQHLEWATVVRNCIDSGISTPLKVVVKEVVKVVEKKVYSDKIPEAETDRHCQKCGKFTEMKRLRPFRVQYELFWFCDDCFFTNTYKEIVRNFI